MKLEAECQAVGVQCGHLQDCQKYNTISCIIRGSGVRGPRPYLDAVVDHGKGKEEEKEPSQQQDHPAGRPCCSQQGLETAHQ